MRFQVRRDVSIQADSLQSLDEAWPSPAKKSARLLASRGPTAAGAELLLKFGHYVDAMYLAGYVVECALKALVLARTPRGNHYEMFQKISRGEKGHDIERLKQILAQGKCQMPADVVERIRRAATWSADWRYRVGLGQYQEAKEYLDAVRYIRAWVQRSL